MARAPIEWPAALNSLIQGLDVVPGQDRKEFCRIDVDVHSETLFLLNEIEAPRETGKSRSRL
jgi:hypothetical protein